jgi:GDSL-like Lipase/Acylhydrolase family
MTRRLRLLLAVPALALIGGLLLGWVAQAQAEHPAECRVPNRQTEVDFPLPNVAKAIARKNLKILVVGAGSSQLPGAEGIKNSYPARLQAALASKLPGVTVEVATDIEARRTAADMLKSLPNALAKTKPQLVIWQTATVDAMQQVDIDQFSQTLDKGINKARTAGADVIFLNPQYSPRTESMIALGIYVENMRWVALQQQVPVFDRFNLMKDWSDLGTFDLYSATKKLDMAERVHDCLGRLLAGLVIEAATPAGPQTEGAR